GKRDRKPCAGGNGGLIKTLEIRWRRDVGPRLKSVAQAQPPAADVPASRHGIDRVVDGRAHVAAAVIGMLRVERQLAEVDVAAVDHHLVHGRNLARYFHHDLRVGQAPEIFLAELILTGLEGCGQASPAAGGLCHDLYLLGTSLPEQDRPRRGFDDRAEADERHPLVMELHFAHVDQPLDKATQSILLHVDGASGRGRCGHRMTLLLKDSGSPTWTYCRSLPQRQLSRSTQNGRSRLLADVWIPVTTATLRGCGNLS